jgi:glycosyltransferase involved in cell wall biosynthesis
VPAGLKQLRELVDDALLAAGGAVAIVEEEHARGGHQPAILARCPAVAIALVTNVLAPYRVPLYARLAERYGVEVLCYGGGADYIPSWFGELDTQLAAAPFPARRLDGPRAALALGGRYRAAIASVAGGMMLPATYLGMRARRRPFVLWASVWAHPRGSATAALAFPLVRHIYRHADAVVAYGPHVSRYVGREDAIVAPQSVEAELFGRPVAPEEIAAWRAEHDLPDGPLVLFVGRLVEEKGIEELLNAWQLLHRRATLVVIGDGPLAARVAGAAGVRHLGSFPRNRLPIAYAAADLVVVPSIPTPRFREPWGLVCNEALHQATSVVATTAVGAAAGGLVRDGETGLVVPPRDPRALADAIDRVLEDASLRARLGTAGKAALAAYTYDAMADAFGAALARAGAR